MSEPSSPTGPGAGAPTVIGANDDPGHEVPLGDLVDLAALVLTAEGVSGPAELGLTFVTAEAMADANRRYRGVEGATDVLAFPIDDDPAGAGPGPRLLGDVLVCPSVAAGNALTHAGSEQAELELLVVHGVLHVLGWDHAEADEEAAMQARERTLLAAWAAREGARR